MIKILFLFNRKSDFNLLKRKLKEFDVNFVSDGNLLPTFSLDVSILEGITEYMVIDPKYKKDKHTVDLKSFNKLLFKYYWIADCDKKIIELSK